MCATQVGEHDPKSAGLKESEREGESEAKNVQGERGREPEKTGGDGVKEGLYVCVCVCVCIIYICM
jgi:hypothetical protein